MPLVRKVRAKRRMEALVTPPYPKQMEKVVVEFMKEEARPRYEAVVANWRHQPKFWVRKTVSSSEIIAYIQPVGEHKKIFEYVNKGTKRHTIRPRPGRGPKARLRFSWGGPGSYRPKTSPAKKPLRLGSGGRPELVFAKVVRHPGTEARLFDEQIESDIRDGFRRAVENAHRRIARQLNKGV